jgi:hypothetical protein
MPPTQINIRNIVDFDKALLSMHGSIERLFLLVKGYYASCNRGSP